MTHPTTPQANTTVAPPKRSTLDRIHNAAFALAITTVAVGIIAVPDSYDLTAAILAVVFLIIGLAAGIRDRAHHPKTPQTSGGDHNHD